MADLIELTVWGHPPIGEVRDRVMFDLRKLNRKIDADVDVVVYRTVYHYRGLQGPLASARVVEEVLAACLSFGAIVGRLSVRTVQFRQPVVDGYDSLTVSIRRASDRLALV